MCHATRFQQQESAVSLPGDLDIPKQYPGVDQRRDCHIRLFLFFAAAYQVCKNAGDLALLQEIDHPERCIANFVLITGLEHAAQWIDDYDGGIEFDNCFVDPDQVHFQTEHGWPGSSELQQTFMYPGLQVNSDRSHVPDGLILRLLESEHQTPFSLRARSICDRGCNAGFSRPGRA